MTHRDYESTFSIIIKFYPIVIENPGSSLTAKIQVNKI
ncbi:hypothetical protein Bsph_4740 [Lysinibacillus sphaericus C3-41]|uniref:Uncharacterized protein n=1 Tax=Lysinibacillus sphaericus (strain C3-41) TaxID=444177 RepID=B1HNX1_LYSSC|nr:hypothetical protein Bsph_4740 [Lysinibacillus sphaericus C3-41]